MVTPAYIPPDPRRLGREGKIYPEFASVQIHMQGMKARLEQMIPDLAGDFEASMKHAIAEAVANYDVGGEVRRQVEAQLREIVANQVRNALGQDHIRTQIHDAIERNQVPLERMIESQVRDALVARGLLRG